MKCCMVACINILYWGNRSAAASAVGDGGGGRVGGFVFFTRFRPFGVDLQNFFFHWKFWLPELPWWRHTSRNFSKFRKSKFSVKKKFCKSTPNGLKRVKNTKPPTRPPPAMTTAAVTADQFLRYVNTSYHTTFHQNLSINVACIHKRVLVAWKWQNAPPPYLIILLSVISFQKYFY